METEEISGGVGLEDAEDIEAGLEADLVDDAALQNAKATSTDPLQVLFRHHPECRTYYVEEITPKLILIAAPPDHPTREGAPDANHRSNAWLSQFERTKIIGFRANQLAHGARPYIAVPSHLVHTVDIARLELKEGRLPFIVARVMPDGNFEFWRLSDLLIL